MPVDAEPNPAGNIVFERGEAKVLGSAAAAEARERGERVWMSHWATCPTAAQHRK